MLSVQEIRAFYKYAPIDIPSVWNLSRKHFRIKIFNNKFVKLNKFENRINSRELRGYCVKYAPLHVYMSVLNWLFPERVGKRYKANYAVPIGGEYAIDVDSYFLSNWHEHQYCSGSRKVCYECIRISQALTIQACEKIEDYYSKIGVVFSGRRGFHIHVHDFDFNDWTHYNEKDPVKSHEVARLKFSKAISLNSFVFDHNHFILSVDPMRVLSVPSSLNAETGLVCQYIGNRKVLEALSVRHIIENSNVTRFIYGCPELQRAMKYFATR